MASLPPPSPLRASEAEQNSEFVSEQENKTLALVLMNPSDHSDANLSDLRIEPILTKPQPKRRRAAHDPSSSTAKTVEKKKKPVSRRTNYTGCITKLWSNEDEVAVLNGIVDYKNDTGKKPSSNLAGFHGLLKGKLSSEFTMDQLRSKITRMKKRFFDDLKKWGGDDGEDPVFSNPHELQVFNISKKIWGGGGGVLVKTKEKTTKEVAEEKVDEEGEEDDFWSKYPHLNDSFSNVAKNYPSLVGSESGLRYMREKISLIGDAKAKELDDKWKKLLVEEMELGYKKMSLMTEQTKLVFP